MTQNGHFRLTNEGSCTELKLWFGEDVLQALKEEQSELLLLAQLGECKGIHF